MAESKNRFPGFVGPSYTSRASRFDCQRAVNLYLETDKTGAGKNSEPAVMISTPGLEFMQTIGAGPIRATYTLSNQQVMYVVSGSQIFQLSGALSTPILIGALLTSTGKVSVADNGIQVLFVDGQFGYYVTIGETVVHQITDSHFYPADLVTFQDGYFILNKKGSSSFFISDLNAVTFPPLNLTPKTGNSDILVAAFSNNRELYLLGANTTEIWYNAGQSGTTPFVRQDGRFSQVGCAAVHSIARLAESFFWLGSNAQGGGVVYTLANAMPTRISTNAVEYEIQKLGDLSGAVGYGYQQEGHYFYALNIPGSSTTWVYDATVEQWHERQSTVDGVIGRNLAQTHCVIDGQHIVGDYRNGNIYKLNLDCYTDNNESRYVMRQSPHVAANLSRIFYKLFEVDFQFGVGLVDNGINSANSVNPRVVLEISNDGGATWGNAIYGSLGQIGQYNHRARWQRLGHSRDRVFRISCTDPVKIQILSAMLDFEVGTM